VPNNDYKQSRPLPPIAQSKEKLFSDVQVSINLPPPKTTGSEDEATSLAGQKVVIAMFDFKASVPGDLSFKRGDLMVLLNRYNF
jgi:hypothetical protein